MPILSSIIGEKEICAPTHKLLSILHASIKDVFKIFVKITQLCSHLPSQVTFHSALQVFSAAFKICVVDIIILKGCRFVFYFIDAKTIIPIEFFFHLSKTSKLNVITFAGL
jgi:hypothetical protein